MADRNVTQEIKNILNIVDIVSAYTQLKPSGNRMKGLSPFTSEKTPSFYVDPDNGVFYCFSSQQGGDLFTFIQLVENIDFKESLKILADKAGVSLENRNETPDQNKTLYDALEKVTHIYISLLNDDVKKHLNNRGINDDSIEKWKIGFAPNAWRTISDNVKNNKDPLVVSGMTIWKEENGKKSIYDRFRGRIMFPYTTANQKVIGFSARMYGELDGAKYINSPETPLFNKSSFLYGLNVAKSFIRKSNFSILSEGVIDTIAFHQSGFPCAVATSGTAITLNHLEQLSNLSTNILIALDSDKAGVKATLRIIPMALSIGMSVKILILPEGTDPADTLTGDEKVLKNAVREAQSITQFLYSYIKEEYGEIKEDIARGIQQVALPIIKSSTELIKQEAILDELSKKSSLSIEALKASLGTAKASFEKEVKLKRKSHKIQDIKTIPQNNIEMLDKFLKDIAERQIYSLEKGYSLHPEINKKIQKIQEFKHLPNVDEKIVILKIDTEIEKSTDKERDFISGFEDIVNRAETIVNKMKENEKYSIDI